MGLHIAKLHRGLGINVAMPVLPLHGPRKVTLVSGEPFLSFDTDEHRPRADPGGLGHPPADPWIRAQGATSIRLYGVSLGRLRGLPAGRHRGRARRRRGWHPGGGLPGALPRHSPRPHPSPVDRAPHHGWCGRGRLPGGLAAAASTRRSRSTDGSSSPVMATAWPPPNRPAALGALGQAPHQLVPGNHVGYLWSTPGDAFLGEVAGRACRPRLHPGARSEG